jgi:hypothetical protein
MTCLTPLTEKEQVTALIVYSSPTGSSPAVPSVPLDDRAPGRAKYRCRATKVARPVRGLRWSTTLAGMRRAYGPPEVLLCHQAFVVSEVNSTCGAAIQIPAATGGFSQVRGCRVGRRAVRRRWALHSRPRWGARGTRRVRKSRKTPAIGRRHHGQLRGVFGASSHQRPVTATASYCH